MGFAEPDPDEMFVPCASPGYRPKVGDWVWFEEFPGGTLIVGPRRMPGDAHVEGLAAENTNQGARLDNLADSSVNQGDILTRHDNRISAEAAANTAQAVNIQNHSDRLNDFGERIAALESQNRNQADVLVAHSDRLTALDNFRTRAAGFAAETHYHGQYLTTVEGDARYVRK